jgi:hypothetical protein
VVCIDLSTAVVVLLTLLHATSGLALLHETRLAAGHAPRHRRKRLRSGGRQRHLH